MCHMRRRIHVSPVGEVTKGSEGVGYYSVHQRAGGSVRAA